MELPFFIVDAFTSEKFTGNSAAVVLISHDSQELNDEVMQRIAAEFNLSETAFVWCSDLARPMKLRWFTPTVEVSLCGHATLATAAALTRHFTQSADRFVFDTASGLLPVQTTEDSLLSLDFPLANVVFNVDIGQQYDISQQLIAATLSDKLQKCVNEVAFSPNRNKVIIQLQGDATVREEFESWTPNFSAMIDAAPSKVHVRGILVTMKDCSNKFDFVCRYFAPWVGINEDPVTGAAHTVLAAYWPRHLGQKETFLSRQCSKRGGVVKMKVFYATNRVHLIGDFVVTAKGTLFA